MPEEISMAGDAVLHKTLVTRGRVTVMALVTAGRMTDTEAARETWSVVLTTVRSSGCITTRRTTAVRGQCR